MVTLESRWQKVHPWSGMFAAMLCAFSSDEEIDEAGLSFPRP